MDRARTPEAPGSPGCSSSSHLVHKSKFLKVDVKGLHQRFGGDVHYEGPQRLFTVGQGCLIQVLAEHATNLTNCTGCRCFLLGKTFTTVVFSEYWKPCTSLYILSRQVWSRKMYSMYHSCLWHESLKVAFKECTILAASQLKGRRTGVLDRWLISSFGHGNLSKWDPLRLSTVNGCMDR